MIPLVSSWWLFLNHNARIEEPQQHESLTELRRVSSDFQKAAGVWRGGILERRELCAERAPEIHHKDHLEFWLNAKQHNVQRKHCKVRQSKALGSSKLNNSQNQEILNSHQLEQRNLTEKLGRTIDTQIHTHMHTPMMVSKKQEPTERVPNTKAGTVYTNKILLNCNPRVITTFQGVKAVLLRYQFSKCFKCSMHFSQKKAGSFFPRNRQADSNIMEMKRIQNTTTI